jgi:uncharacterized protein YggT (Ycf19 family)
MTHDHRHDDPDHLDHDHDHADETRVVERQTYVERERPVATGYVPPAQTGYVPPAQPVGGQVNVNADAGPRYVEPVRGPMYWARRVLTLLFTVLTVLLAIRVILFLLVANQANQIVDFVYGVTEPFVAPFRGIFAFDNVQPGGGIVFDIAAVVAFIGWLLIYLLLMAILSLADRDTTRA